MLTVIFEDAGTVIGEHEMSPHRRSMLTRLVQEFHCFEHGEPTGVAHVDVKTLRCVVDRTCCPVYLAKLANVFGG